MSSELVTMVFPDGKTEYRTVPRRLLMGDGVRHLGADFVVDRVDLDGAGATVVTLGYRRPEVEQQAIKRERSRLRGSTYIALPLALSRTRAIAPG